MCPYQISCEQKHFRIAELVRNHNKVVSLLTGDSTTDVQILNKSDVIICTPTQWDMMSRRWKQRKDVQVKCCSKQQKVGLFIVDDLHLIGGSIGPIIEIVLSRMILMNNKLQSKLRIVALSASLANAKIIGQWLRCKPNTIFNFQPSVRPVPLEIHIKVKITVTQSFDINHFGTRMLAMAKPAYNSIVSVANREPVIVFVPSRKQVIFIVRSRHN